MRRMMEENKKTFLFAGIIAGASIIAWIVGAFIFPKEIESPWNVVIKIASRTKSTSIQQAQPQIQLLPSESAEQILLPSSPWKFTLQQPSMLFTGGYADPSVIKLDDKSYLMYLNKTNRGTFVLGSANAFSWNKKTDVVFSKIATGRAFIFDTGIRFYYPKTQIYSSFSYDGLTDWNNGSIMISPRNGYILEGPSVFKLKDTSYRMFFSEIKQSSVGGIVEGEIYGATSTNGISWIRDSVATIIYDPKIEGFGQGNKPPQTLRPFVINWTSPMTKEAGYLMLYNSHSKIFAAYSANGFEWEKLGYTGIEGTGVNGIYTNDGLRIYYGYSAAEGIVYTGILEIAYLGS